MNNLIYYLILSAGFLLTFLLGELMLNKVKVKPEYSRKLVHMVSGLLTCFFPVCFDNHWWVLAICLSFFVLLFLSAKYGFLKGINSVDRKSYGGILFPVAIYSSYILNDLLNDKSGFFGYYYSSVLYLVFSDPLAAIVGINFPVYRFKKIAKGKSIGGSLAFFISALVISLITITGENCLLNCLIISMTLTLVELFSKRGVDNLLVPVTAFLLYYVLF